MRPRLKDVYWERSGAELRLVRDAHEQLRLDDPDGMVELLLDLLFKGSRTPPELAEVVGVPVATVDRVVDVLDRHRLLVDDERAGRIGADTRDRYADNLAFFDPYATLALGREDMLERLRTAHVLLLGLGGVNMTAAAQLCGLGVDRLTVVDTGTIVARDLGWQPFARSRDVGTRTVRRAAAWLREAEPSLHVDAVDSAVGSASALSAMLDRYCPDLVIVDDVSPFIPHGRGANGGPSVPTPTAGGSTGGGPAPRGSAFGGSALGGSALGDIVGGDGVDVWVNAACVGAGLPFVRAIIGAAGAAVYSVDPGRSGCVACMGSGSANGQAPAVMRLLNERPGGGLHIGPVAGLLGSLVAFEAMRYLTGFEPPAYAGQPIRVEISSGGGLRRLGWQRSPSCPVCRRADPR
ncbi:MAG TPA: ThiF family adenylyltransferase [Micromonosporaceae bacterium]|nr:ThiF family adenylyltransferase [Micromonosporaceae bacterium]